MSEGYYDGKMELPISVTKIAHTMPFSREMLRMSGLVESTPEELAADAKWQADYAIVKAADDAMIAKARTELDAIDNAAIQAVLRLHAPTDNYGSLECAECTYGEAYDHDYWPCLTVHTIADAYGIEFP